MASQTHHQTTSQTIQSLAVLFASATLVLMSQACGQRSEKVGSDVVQNTENRVLLPAEDPPPGTEGEFTTDFTRHTVPYSEITSGGPRKDGIPAVDHTTSLPIDSVETDFLSPTSPLLIVTIGGQTRGYPIGILMRHEIVNDTLAGVPISVTYCPLCNSGIAFDRRHDGRVLDFGTTGRLRLSNLVMYDRQTESWWQQGTGEAIAGEYAAVRLERFAATILSWEQFRSSWPESSVLLPPGGEMRRYRTNPYSAYDNPASTRPFLYKGEEIDNRLPVMARVLGFFDGDTALAFPYRLLRERKIINASVGGLDLVVVWKSGVSSALDSDLIEEGRDVGGGIAFDRHLNGSLLTFALDENEEIVDRETKTRWSLAGRAIEGPLEGASLQQMGAWNYLWFSWVAFHPGTGIYTNER